MAPTGTGPVFGAIENPDDEWVDEEPIPFRLIGYTADSRHEPTEFEFSAKRHVSLGAEWDAASSVDARGKVDMPRALSYMEHSLVPEDRARFFETLHDDGYHFHAQAIIDLAEWLIEERTERPPSRPGASSAGRPGTGRGSGAGSSSRASATRARSR